MAQGAERATVYVRGDGRYTVKGIRAGTYTVFTASGVDWDAGKKGFTRDCAFGKFDSELTFGSSARRWTIVVAPVGGGNTTSSEVDPGAFPIG